MLTRLFTRPEQPRKIRVINAISMCCVFLALFMYTTPYFMSPVDADWKEPVIIIGGGIAAGVAIYVAVATAPVWLTITGATAGGIAAGTAIWEWLDDDCDDCDGSGCLKCDPPDDDDCDDCDGGGCKTCLPPLPDDVYTDVYTYYCPLCQNTWGFVDYDDFMEFSHSTDQCNPVCAICHGSGCSACPTLCTSCYGSGCSACPKFQSVCTFCYGSGCSACRR